MKNLDMIKAFAELEGVETYIAVNPAGVKVVMVNVCSAPIKNVEYNPITDLALNCAARDKYMVSTSHGEVFDCGIDGNGSYDIPACYISHCDTTIELMNVDSCDIPNAVIECILKSKGLWVN